jgi:DNA-binding LytR/AlgR family response regulator
MKCALVDDEPLARRGLENFIKDTPYLQLVGACSNITQLISVLNNNNVDLLFLDIQLPKVSGINFLKNTQHKPVTIITTAYPNYALESYELDVMDYLVKPIAFERFLKAVNKAKEYLELQQSARGGKKNNATYFFLKCDGSYQKILFDDILFIEALLNYVVVHTIKQKFMSYLTLKMMEDYLDNSDFLKINKSNVVSIKHIDKIEGNQISIGQHQLIISRAMKDDVMSVLDDRLLRR